VVHADGVAGAFPEWRHASESTDFSSGAIRTTNFLSRFFERFSRPTPLETGVLEKTCAMLDEIEGRLLRLQVQLAVFQRHPSGHIVEFHYRKWPPEIPRLATCQSIHCAVLAVRGSVSGFSTVATVRLTKGVLRSLEFDTIPWAAHEPLEIEGRFMDLVETAGAPNNNQP
jgi:hypothetical protein